ncbi:MAG: outer membrane beta-barrel protein [Cryomorphaceae bacterium]
MAKLGMTAGFHLGYQFTDNIRLESGLLYANKGYRTEKMDANFGDALDPRRGITFSETAELTHARFIESFHYIAVPLKVNFSFGGEKWKWLADIGVMNEFLVEATNTAVTYNGSEVTDSNTETSGTDFRPFSLSPVISVGVEYVLSPNMSLRAEPTFRYGVLQTTDIPVTEHLYSAGLQIGYIYRL